jgi:hypothetical protein
MRQWFLNFETALLNSKSTWNASVKKRSSNFKEFPESRIGIAVPAFPKLHWQLFLSNLH